MIRCVGFIKLIITWDSSYMFPVFCKVEESRKSRKLFLLLLAAFSFRRRMSGLSGVRAVAVLW
jgi:hypothetical protein